MTSESIVLYANSAKRSSGGRSSFTVNLTKPITHFKSFEILGVEVPYTFYNIWDGNVSICDLIPDGQDPLLIKFPIHDYRPLVAPQELFSNPLNLAISFDGKVTIIDISGYTGQFNQFSYDGMGQRVIDSGVNGVTACSFVLEGFRLRISIECSAPFTKFGFVLAGTDTNLARYLGLTEDTIKVLLSPNYATNLLMPSPLNNFDHRAVANFGGRLLGNIDLGSVRYDLDLLGDNNGDPNTFIVYNLRVNANTTTFTGDFSYTVNPTTGSIFVDPSRHYLSWMVGLNGSYPIGSTITALSTYITPPKVYDNSITFITMNNTYTITLPEGNYTNQEIASSLNALLGAIGGEMTGSTVTLNADSTISFYLIAPLSTSIGFTSLGGPGTVRLLERLGFTDNQLIQPVSEYTFTSNRPIKKHSSIYVQSVILSNLMSTSTLTDTDNPTYEAKGIIHKVQIQALPGGYITDNSKYKKEHLVTKMRTPVTSIDFTILDEDGQVIDLHGRDWSIGIKFNF